MRSLCAHKKQTLSCVTIWVGSFNSLRYKLGTDFPGNLLIVFSLLNHRKHLTGCLIFQSLSVVKVFPVQVIPQAHIQFQALPYLLDLWLKWRAESGGCGLCSHSQEVPATALFSQNWWPALLHLPRAPRSPVHTHTHTHTRTHTRACVTCVLFNSKSFILHFLCIWCNIWISYNFFMDLLGNLIQTTLGNNLISRK